MSDNYGAPPIPPTLTVAQFWAVLAAAYLAEAEGLVTFDADLRDALNAIHEHGDDQ
jgi:hypothetical protein